MITIRNKSQFSEQINETETEDGRKYSFKYPCPNYSECTPYEITFSPGFYFLEVYGASGSTIFDTGFEVRGGYGGYSSGVFISRTKRKLYLYIGGSQNVKIGESGILSNSFNGGKEGGNNIYDGIGGGATDFRTKGGSWYSNFESRIIVAGGGGSGRSRHLDSTLVHNYPGGNGGGIEGEPGSALTCSPAYGTQNQSKYLECSSEITHVNGRFGFGASGGWAGGGGGYYGGGLIYNGAGGGGSGYIGGVESIGKYQSITQTSSHSGFGYAEITILTSFSFMNKFLNTFHSPFISHIPSYYLFISLYLS